MGSSSVAAPAKLEVRPIAGSLGAEVIGLDFSAVSAVADELRKALNEHLVLFMPGLNPTAEGLRDIAATFGPLEVHPYLDKVDPEIPEVIVLDTSTTPKADVLAHRFHLLGPSPRRRNVAHGRVSAVGWRHDVDQLLRGLRLAFFGNEAVPRRADLSA